MRDCSSIAKDTIKIFSNDLIIGNHDSLTLFGIHAQNSLKDYSRRIATLLLKETENLDMAMSEVICEIEQFEKNINRTFQSAFRKSRNQRDIIEEYNKILSYIDNMTLYFKLQQAQLIKEVKLLDKMRVVVTNNAHELEQCIKDGNSVLNGREAKQLKDRELPTLENTNSEDEIWYKRLMKRIEDLSISHTVSLQIREQIRVLHDNDLLLLDRVASTISNVLPIWQNQMALMLGLDLFNKRLNVQDSILNSSEKHVEQSLKKNKDRQIISKSHDANRIIQLNQFLKKALDEMTQLEANDSELRKEILTTTYRGEGDKDHE